MCLPNRVNPEVLQRVFADAVMVNASVLAVFVGRFSAFFFLRRQDLVDLNHVASLLEDSLRVYANSAWLLTLIGLIVFWGSGFYTHGRAYRGRYKFLVVLQAVTIAFLLFSFISLFLPVGLGYPKSVLLGSWALTLVFLETARLWMYLWQATVGGEFKPRNEIPQDIRNVLVIGGAGYIGSALLPKLLDKGYRVRLLDLLLFGTEPVQDLLDHPHLEMVQADFRQVDRVVDAMRGMDAVIHLGAIVGDPACALDEELTIEVNLMATKMIAEVAKGSGVNRLIFASTCSVYGASDQLLDEHSSLNPVSLYARSKIACERVLGKLADEQFVSVILRFGTIYGLSGRTRFDLVINLLTAKAIVDGQITVFGGDQWRPFLHVDDAALAVLKALQAPLHAVRNQAFNVGSDDQNYTIGQIGEIVHRLVPTAQIVDRGADKDKRNYRVNFGKIRNTLGFEPHWTVEQGVQQVVQAFKSGKIKNYQDAKYSNVKFLSDESLAIRIRRENGWAHELIKETAPTFVVTTGG